MINVGGNRIGTAEIESAILAQRGETVSNCIVVGMPHALLGSRPVAFVVPQPGTSLSLQEQERLRSAVTTRLGGEVRAALCFVAVSMLPETHSGKYLRRILAQLLVAADLGDLAALRNPECVPELRVAARCNRTALSNPGRAGHAFTF